MTDTSRLTVAPETAGRADVTELLAAHVALMRAQTPQDSCHVMSADCLSASGARLYSLREDG